MDAAYYYEDLRGRLFSLLILLEDRLGGEQAQQIHHFIDVDEYGLALEEMAGVLAQAGGAGHRPGARRHAGLDPENEDG